MGTKTLQYFDEVASYIFPERFEELFESMIDIKHCEQMLGGSSETKQQDEPTKFKFLLGEDNAS